MSNTTLRSKNILFNVLNQEVVFEEYFCNLISIDSFKDSFIQFIDNEILKNELISNSSFFTEKNLDDNCGRADLFLNLKSKKIIFEIKNKVYTDLTKNQPEAYLKYLEKNNKDVDYNRCLFFLIPRNYKHTEDIINRWVKISPSFNPNKQILYWEDFALLFKNEINPYVKAFYDFCMYWFNLNPVEFKKDEIEMLHLKGDTMNLINNETIPTLMLKLEHLVMNIANTLGWQQYPSPSGLFYSHKIKMTDYEILIGVDYHTWSQSMPISISIYNSLATHFELPKIDSIDFFEDNSGESIYYEKEFRHVVRLKQQIGEESFEEYLKKTIAIIIQKLSI